ncbi:MAG: response regulator, partial [Candidatus Eremiobacteraeota bacterium]|nr:response regulator [Candidatus Eremiobacteraeota bacterium]
LAAWTVALAHGTPYEAEHRLRAKDGVYRWFLGRALPIADENGSIAHWFGTATDIDEQKRTLEAQRRLTEQLQVVVDATDRLSNSLDAQESLQTLCELIAPRFADWMAVNLIEADGRIRNVALVHADPSKADAVATLRGTYYLDPSVRGAVVSVLQTNEPVLTSNYTSSEDDLRPAFAEQRKALGELGLASVIGVPLLVRGRTIGVLTTVWSQSDKRYSEAEIPFFQELAKRAAVAFDDAARHSAAHVSTEIARRIMQSSDDCIAVLSHDAHLMTVNDQGAATFARAGALLELGCEWSACWRSEDRPLVDAALTAARAGSIGTYQGRLRGAHRTPQWWDVVVTPIMNVAGTPTQLLAVSRNITRQKDHESSLEAIAARYRAFADAIPAIAFTATAKGTLDFVNDRWIQYSGMSSQVSLERGLVDVTHPGEASTLTEDWFDAIERGLAPETETRLRRAADGVYRWHLIRAVPIRNSDGKVVQWFGTGTDIDDQKRAEAAIVEARDAALQAALVKSQFVATMSHEIRTPISGVIGMAELLLITRLSDEQREYASVVRDSGQSLLRVVNDILDYSKLDAGKLQLESVEFDVASQVRSVAALLRAQIELKRIELTMRVDPDVASSVIGDPGRVRQILVNLVGNAVKFTPAGGRVDVHVASVVSNSGPTRLRFAVEDNGVGIAANVQSRLFEAFSQGDGSTTRKYGGTGLGLSICKQLVELMGGTIGLQSELGRGSIFSFSIDFALVERNSTPAASTSDLTELRTTALNRKDKILLVEDNDINTLLAQRQFQQLGYTISTASNGREALASLRDGQFDLVFMDCHMPEMDGFEATQAIRRLELGGERRLPIVAMTADAQMEDQTACLAAGMDDYLSKPVSLAQLSEVLARWLPIPT